MSANSITPAVSPFDYLVNGYLIVNLVITDISHSSLEKVKIDPQMGDKFSVHYYGKSPVVLQITGVILNPYDDSHKAGMVSVYRYLLRLSKVVEMQIRPALTYLGNTVTGAMLNMNTSEQAMQEGIINISFDWLVFNMTMGTVTTSSTSTTDTEEDSDSSTTEITYDNNAYTNWFC
jgi:hypothetical protein